MIDLKSIVRPNILELIPYASARDDFKGDEGTFLDANENPYGELNRYPDPYQKKLKQKIEQLKNINSESIFIGNGSDEVIDLAFRIFCNPNKDKALTFSPTYGMYSVSAAINNVELVTLPLNNNFQIDLEEVDKELIDKTIKLIFICSPNNPTGNLINKEDIEYILKKFNGIVIIDEAYIDFSNQNSLISLINQYNNLIISQTFSKAWGIAAARIGTAYANKEIIELYNKVKPPYNISKTNQESAINALNNYNIYQNNLSNILSEKKRLEAELQKIKIIKKIYPSQANFFLVEVNNANQVYNQLIQQKIIIRDRSKQVTNCLRISIGKPKENDELLNALKKLS